MQGKTMQKTFSEVFHNIGKSLFLYVLILTFTLLLITLNCIEWPWEKFKINPNLSLFLTTEFDSTFILESFILHSFTGWKQSLLFSDN